MLDIEKITSQTRLAEYGSKINSIIDSVYLPDEDTIIIRKMENSNLVVFPSILQMVVLLLQQEVNILLF